MSLRIAAAVALLVASLGSPVFAGSEPAPAGASASGGVPGAPAFDDITTGSIAQADGGQLSVRLPELSTGDGLAPGTARHYGPRGEPLAY